MPKESRYSFFLILTLVLAYSTSILATSNSNQAKSIKELKTYNKYKNESSKPKKTVKAKKSSDHQSANSAHLTFVLQKTLFKGNQAITSATIRKIFKPYYGKKISLKKLQALVTDVTNLYMAKGYILSHAYLPPQSISKGLVKIYIVEGFITHINISGSVGTANSKLIHNLAQPIKKSKPLDNAVLESAILKINQIPGMKARAVLAPNKGTQAAADLTIVVKKQASSFNLQANNFGNKLVDYHKFHANGSFYASKLPGSETSLAYSQAKNPKDSQMFGLSQELALGNKGGKLTARATLTKNKPNYTSIGLPPSDNEKGETKEYSLSYFHPILSSRNNSRSFNISLTNGDNSLKDDTGMIFHDIITSLKGEFSFKKSGQFFGFSAQNSYRISAEKGLDLFGAKADLPSREGGKLDYTKAEVSLQHMVSLTPVIGLQLSLSGQYSQDVLLASTEYSVGGSGCGRGYDSGEILGDKGICSAIDLTVALPVKQSSAQAYAFYDQGRIWNNKADETGQIEKDKASSSGFGIKFSATNNLAINAFYAKPLDHIVSLEENKDGRLFFNIVYSG